MAWLDKVRQLEYPQAGKYLIFVMLLLELSIYVYLAIASRECLKAILLSVGLIIASFLTVVSCGLSLPTSFYFKHWIIYNIIGLLSLVGRVTMLIWIMILNFEISDELFMTQEGYAGLMRTSLIFLILQAILIYEKCNFFRTQKEVSDLQVYRLIRV